MNFRRNFLAALTAAFGLLAVPASAEDIQFHHGSMMVAPGAGMSGAAFGIIHNNTAIDDRLIGAKFEFAARAEIHLSEENADGVMTMTHLEEGIPVVAGGEIELKRGGLHVMFMGLSGTFEDGATVPLTLIFEQAGEVTIDLVVGGAADAMHHGDQDGAHVCNHDENHASN